VSTDIELLKTALSYKITTDIVVSDQDIDGSEQKLIFDRFPYEDMVASGLINKDGYKTPKLHKLVEEAIDTLPGVLSEEDRLQLFDGFIDVVAADDELQEGEAAALREAAVLLGLSDDAIDARMEAHPAVGVVELGEPE
jgi:hypothetical protein